jgi:hypothetical protein
MKKAVFSPFAKGELKREIGDFSIKFTPPLQRGIQGDLSLISLPSFRLDCRFSWLVTRWI